MQGAAGFAGLPAECNAQLVNQKCKKANCVAEYVQPLADDKPWYLLVKARRDIKPGCALTLTYNNVKSLAVCQRLAEELGPGWAAEPCHCRKRQVCLSGKGFLVKVPRA